MGLLSITPRDENGNEVTNFETRILHDAQGRELKAWQAFASYLQVARNDLSPGPVSKTVAPSWNPVKLLIPMGMPTLVVLLAVILLIALVVLIVYLICARKARRARRLAAQTNRKTPKN